MKFPVYNSQQTPNVGRAPRISTSAFAAPGRAIAQVGNQLSAVEQHAQNRADQRSLFQFQTGLNDAKAQAHLDFNTNLSNSPTGHGVAQQTMGQFEAKGQQLLNNVPAHLKDKATELLSRRAAGLRVPFTNKELGARYKYYQGHLGKAITNSENLVQTDPSSFAEQKEDIEGLIENTELPGYAKQQLRTNYMQRLEYAHAAGRINQGDYDGVKEDLQRVPKLPDLKIQDIRKQNRREGRARQGSIKGVVFHHTAGSTLEGALTHGNKVGTGTHYYIDRDGSVHQFASDKTKMIHVREAISGYRTDKGKFKHLGNDSTIGVEIVARNAQDVTAAQNKAAAALARSLTKKHKIDPGNVVSHADLQGGPGGNRQHDEGVAAVKEYRKSLNAKPEKEGEQEEGFVYESLDADQRSKLLKLLNNRFEGKRFELKERMADDIESIRRTGQGVKDVDLETAGRILKLNQLNRYRIQREQAKYEFEALQSLPELRDDQLTERLNKLEPKPGQKGFDFLSGVYDKAQKQITKIRKMRSDDPAQSVADFDLVKEATQNLDPENPKTYSDLVAARLASQERLGIHEGNQQPITKEEAKVILAPIRNLKGDELVTELRNIIKGVNGRYGRYGRQVFLSAIHHASRSAERAEIATGILEDYLDTGTVSKKKRNQVQDSNQTENIQKSINPDIQAEEDEALRMRLEMAPKEFMKPNKDHIEALKKNPDLAEQFDEKFGPGMAAQILGGSK